MMLPIETMHILFLLQNTLQYLLHYPACFIGIKPKRKSNDHFKVVECSPTFKHSQIASLGAYRAKRSILIYSFDGSSECRGYYPEQLTSSISDIHTLPLGMFTQPDSLIVIIVRSIPILFRLQTVR